MRDEPRENSQTPAERHADLARKIDACFEEIPNPTSISIEARYGKRAARWYAFGAVVLLLLIVSVVSRVLLETSERSAPFATLFSAMSALLPALAIFLTLVVLIGLSRRWRAAPFDSVSRKRVRLWSHVNRIKNFEKTHTRELGDAVSEAKKHRERFSPPPQELEQDALSCADQLALATLALPIGASEEEYISRGRKIKAWQLPFWFGVGVTVALTLAAAAIYAGWVGGLLSTPLAETFARFGPLALGLATILIFAPTARLIALRGFASDGSKALAMWRAQQNLSKVLLLANRYGRDHAMRINRSIAEAGREFRQKSRRKTVFDETRDGISGALDDANNRAIIQAMAGTIIAIGALTIAAYSLFLLQWDFEGGRLSPGQMDAAFWTLSFTKLAFAVGANALAFFFLIGFRKSQADAKFFRNELTTIEARMMALDEARKFAREHEDPELRRFAVATAGAVIVNLGSLERNPVHLKGASNANVQEHKAINTEAQVLAEYARLKNPPQAQSS